MNGARAGLLYLAAAGILGYAWVTGNLAKVVDYATRAAGGTPTGGAQLQPTHPLALPKFKGRPATASRAPVLVPVSAHPGGHPLPTRQEVNV